MAGLYRRESSASDEDSQPGKERDVSKPGKRERSSCKRREPQQSKEPEETKRPRARQSRRNERRCRDDDEDL